MENDEKKSQSLIYDEYRNTPLHFAAARGHLEDTIKEIENGHKINFENYLGWTPLMMATRNGHLDVVKILLEKRADATRKNKFGSSIFHMAVASGNLDVLHVILQHLLCGGVSRQIMESAISPISIAILFNYERIFDYLLEREFNPNAVQPDTGLTPLMYAALSENQKFYGKLLSKGANVTAKTVNGQTAEAILTNQKGLIYYLQPPQLTPNVIVYNASPIIPQFNHCTEGRIRKSPEIMASPNFTPQVSPITPMNFHPQYFFPPTFSTPPFFSTMNTFYYDNIFYSPQRIMSPHLNCNISSSNANITLDNF